MIATRALLLRAYYTLRNDSEARGAAPVTLIERLRLMTFAGGRGFIAHTQGQMKAENS